jgi:hypothetical protein
MPTKKKAGSKTACKSSKLQPDEPEPPRPRPAGEIAAQIRLACSDGVVIVGGDAHYFPGEPPSTAHRALARFIKELAPRHVIINGDVLDASTISKHQRIGWELRPSLVDEIELCQERLHEIELACPRGATRSWCIGNHDIRYETRLSAVASEYCGIAGMRLVDHFPAWNFAWAAELNDEVTIKHRWKGGVHAPYNNVVNSGKTIITGHLHSAKVIPFSDYSGTRFGVDHGCLADTKSRAFVNYTESNPLNWRSGFCVLTLRKGQLLFPELVTVFNERKGVVHWRGELIEV